MPLEPRGPELRALYTTRRWLLSILTTVMVSLSAIRALLSWDELASLERASVVVALALVVTGALASARPAFLWCSVGGPFVLVLTALLAPVGSPEWIPMPNVVTYSIGFAVLLVPRRVGLLLLALVPVAIGLVLWRDPSNIVSGVLQLGGGWIVVAQVMATVGAIWLAWWALVPRAEADDREYEARRHTAEAALAQQERSRIWRDTASRIHESVLNSIRYVLTTESIDRSQLARELDAHAVVPEVTERPHALTLDDLMSAVLGDPMAAGVVRLPATRPAAELTPEVFAASRAALVEAALNAIRHGRATRVELSFDVLEPGLLTVRAADNGIGLPAAIRPGFGVGAILAGGLADVGGTAAIEPGPTGGAVVTVTVPADVPAPARRRRAPYGPFDRGRLLLSAPLAAAAAVGVVYYLLLGPVAELDQTGGAHYWLTLICGISGAVAAATLVIRRRHPSTLAGLGLVLLPAFVPWFLRTADYGCDLSSNLAAVLNIAGFAVIAISLWAGVVPGVVGVLTWASGILVVSTSVPEGCRQDVTLALANSLIIIPIAIIVAFVGLRADQRAADRLESARRRALVEESRAQAQMELNGLLYGSVEEGMETLAGLAAGRPLDEQTRTHLAIVDSRIRVAIQVGAGGSGALAMLGQRVVESAASVGRSVQVRAIGGSGDADPVPLALERMLVDAVLATSGCEPLLQVFTDGRTDYLSVVIDEAGLAATGLGDGDAVVVGSLEVQVMAEEDPSSGVPATYSLLVSRPIAEAARA